MVLNMEGHTTEDLDKITEIAKQTLVGFDGLDMKAL